MAGRRTRSIHREMVEARRPARRRPLPAWLGPHGGEWRHRDGVGQEFSDGIESKEKRQRRSVSRVLCPERVTQGDDHFSRTPVARRLKRPNPRARTGRPIALLFGLAPGGVCLADAVTRAAGELLPHRFTLTALRRRYVSVALSVGSPPLAVSQHPALRSPDFPPAVLPRPATVRSSLARPLV
jgi:hypothetical protein